ncbi:hypothetical protein, partial [Pseudovibrio flavus]|uniref:hypothetical protein n=1 Tax=Pseudovibrio flavus TaxID=2529854 RepID=UPI00211D047E
MPIFYRQPITHLLSYRTCSGIQSGQQVMFFAVFCEFGVDISLPLSSFLFPLSSSPRIQTQKALTGDG